MPNEIAGDSGTVLLDSVQGARTLQALIGTKPGLGKTRIFSVYCPDGSDPPGTGILAANTETILVGPNSTAMWPLAPGAWKDFDDVDPALMAFDSRGNASQRIFYAYGGQKPEE